MFRDHGLQHGRVPSGRIPVADEGQAERRQAHPRRSAIHAHERELRHPRAHPRGVGHRVPRRIDQLRHQQRALEHGSLLQGVRGQLHQRRNDRQRRLQGHRRSRRRVLGTRAIHREARVAVQRVRRLVSAGVVAVQVAAGAGAGRAACGLRAGGRTEASAGTTGRPAGWRSSRPATAGAAQLGRRGAVAQEAGTAARSHASESTLLIPGHQAALRSIHARSRRADHGMPAGEVPPGRRDAASKLRSRSDVGIRVRGRVDAAHVRRPDDQLLRAPAAAVRQHRPPRRRDHGAARPRRHPGLDRRADAVPQHPRVHEPPDGAEEARVAP